MLLIFTTKKPYDQGKLADLVLGKDRKDAKHNDKAYLINASGNSACFASETIFVAASTEAAMKRALDRPTRVRAEGPQGAALNLAMKKHHMVVGLNLNRRNAWPPR